MKHWRYKTLYWDYTSTRWEFLLKKEPKKYYCQSKGCPNAAEVFKLKSGKASYTKHCNKCKRRRWRVNNPIHHMFSELRRSAKRRGIYFDLHRGEFIEFCFNNNFYRDSSKFTKDSLTVDRVDENFGYTMHNLQIMSNHDNVVKANKARKSHSKTSQSDNPF